MKKLSLLFVTLSVTFSVFGQDALEPVRTDTLALEHNVAGELKVRKNSIYTIGANEISFEQALMYAAPYDQVVKKLTAGRNTRKVAVGAGKLCGGLMIAGGALVLSPIFSAFSSEYDDDSTSASSDDDSSSDVFIYIAIGGVGLIGVGILAGLTSLTLHICSTGFHHRAARLYNEAVGYAARPTRPNMDLSLGLTPGGLGLQLCF
jgi:hypothetical protein